MKALFLDRDGVINKDTGYAFIWKPDLIVPGIIELILRFKSFGYKIVIVTNQSGIGRGYFTEDQFSHFMRELKHFLDINAAGWDHYYYCSCDPSVRNCPNRKPGSGMFMKAFKQLGIHAETSVMVGDNLSDIQASINAGILQNFVFNLNGNKNFVNKPPNSLLKFVTVSDLANIVPRETSN